MITELTLLAFYAPTILLLQGLFALIPDMNFLADVNSPVSAAFNWFLGLANFMNPIVPASTISNILTIIIGYYAFLFSFRFISWILRKIPFVGIS